MFIIQQHSHSFNHKSVTHFTGTLKKLLTKNPTPYSELGVRTKKKGIKQKGKRKKRARSRPVAQDERQRKIKKIDQHTYAVDLIRSGVIERLRSQNH